MSRPRDSQRGKVWDAIHAVFFPIGTTVHFGGDGVTAVSPAVAGGLSGVSRVR